MTYFDSEDTKKSGEWIQVISRSMDISEEWIQLISGSVDTKDQSASQPVS